jgi:repressor of nif and glnA expression
MPTVDNPILYNILKVLANSDMPLGAKTITEKLEERGITVKKDTVQHYLRVLDDMGLTIKIGLAGRVISSMGMEELRKGMLKERIGSFIEQREEYAYQADFDPKSGEGFVSLNLGIVDESELDKSLKLIRECVDAGLAMSPLIKIYDNTRTNKIRIPEGKVGIGLVSTSVVDAAFITSKIYPSPTFAGVLQYMNREPVRFIHAISYVGSTLDPIDLFIKSGFCSVKSVVKRGYGTIPADVREIPAVMRKRAIETVENLIKSRIGGVICVGEANAPTLGVPVNNYRVGVVVIAGSTPLAYLKENGIDAEIRILAAFEKYDNLEHIDNVI